MPVIHLTVETIKHLRDLHRVLLSQVNHMPITFMHTHTHTDVLPA
jgi:hypothetical protein